MYKKEENLSKEKRAEKMNRIWTLFDELKTLKATYRNIGEATLSDEISKIANTVIGH